MGRRPKVSQQDINDVVARVRRLEALEEAYAEVKNELRSIPREWLAVLGYLLDESRVFHKRRPSTLATVIWGLEYNDLLRKLLGADNELLAVQHTLYSAFFSVALDRTTSEPERRRLLHHYVRLDPWAFRSPWLVRVIEQWRAENRQADISDLVRKYGAVYERETQVALMQRDIRGLSCCLDAVRAGRTKSAATLAAMKEMGVRGKEPDVRNVQRMVAFCLRYRDFLRRVVPQGQFEHDAVFLSHLTDLVNSFARP